MEGKWRVKPEAMDKIGGSHLQLSLPRSAWPRLHPKARLLRNSNRKEAVKLTGFSIKIKVRGIFDVSELGNSM